MIANDIGIKSHQSIKWSALWTGHQLAE